MDEKKKYIIIVESPTQAQAIQSILGNHYNVIATRGHILRTDLAASHPGHLREFLGEGALRPQVAAAQVLLRGMAAEVGKDVPFLEILAQAYGGVLHLQRRQDLVLHQLAVGAPPGVRAPHRLAHEGVVAQRRIMRALSRRVHGAHVLADGGDDLVQPVYVHARPGDPDRGQARGVGQQMEKSDVLARLAGELGNDLGDLGGQGELPLFYGAKDQDIGDGLGHGKQAEYGIHPQRAAVFRVGKAYGLAQSRFAVPGDHDHRAEVTVPVYIFPYRRAQVFQPVIIQAVVARLHTPPLTMIRVV